MTSKPDWRKPADYPDPADTSLHRWASEFLRRNPIFEAEFKAAAEQQRVLKAAGTLPSFWSDQPAGAVLKRWGVRSPVPWNLRGRRTSGALGDTPVIFDTAPRFVRTSRRGDEVELAYSLLRADRLLLEFDLDAPLDPQLERARLMLAAGQRHNFPAWRRQRNQTEKFPLYLRVLDALAAGAARGEMLREFQHHRADAIDDRTLRYWIKRATALRDGGYRDLLRQ